MGRSRVTGVVRPFRALIVREESAAQNVSRMTDALPASERTADVQAHPGPAGPSDSDAYDECGPALYVYRLRRGHDQHVGVVGDVSAEAFVDGRIRGHEAVQPNRVKALVDHYSSAAVRSELVALLHRSGPAVDAAILQTVSEQPLIEFTGPDEWEQTVWRVPDAAGKVLADELSRGVHYIADGHHRVAASLSVWHQEGRPPDAGLMCVMFPFDGLRLLAFHRRVTGPVDPGALLTLLSEAFDFADISHPDEATGCFGLYVDGRWYDARYTGERSPGAAGLDIAILNEQVLEPLLGLDELATSRIQITSALSSILEQTLACDEDSGALFALRPPALDQLIDVADRGEVMPPKTTYFDPKPYAGIFLR
jgi:uncharacterized protein (DUF1015 family)